jgi:arylsulfatase A-like enzyme
MRVVSFFVMGLSLALILGAAPAVSAAADQASLPQPNVLVVLADDLGRQDVTPFNPDTFYETPNIQRIADSGMKFTDAYVPNPVCSPSRFSVMTGQYPTRRDATNYFCGKRTGRYRGAKLNCYMPVAETTVAEAFNEAGYTTFFAGKWHLGPDPKHWPGNQGFDINKGGFSAGFPYYQEDTGYFSPYKNPRLENGPKGEYLPYRLADETSRFVENHQDEQFFACLSFYEVHNPKAAPEQLVQKYREKRKRLGLEDVDKFERMEQVWPNENLRKERVVQSHPVYAAMVEAMDRAIGQVLDTLEKTEQADSTIVVFLSDQGGLSTSHGHNTSNRPLRGGKGWIYEGGIRTPLLVSWPGMTEPGSVKDQPVMSTDLYPTLLEMAGLSKRPKQHKDGMSFVPLLKGQDSIDRGPLYWHYPHYSPQGGPPGGGIRIGHWKLIERYEDGSVELYNLKEDIGERNNLAEQKASRVKRMRRHLHQWYQKVGANFLRQKGDGPMPWRPDYMK